MGGQLSNTDASDSFTSEEIKDYHCAGYVKIIMFRVVVKLGQGSMGVGRAGGLCSHRIATKGSTRLSSESLILDFLIPNSSLFRIRIF